MLPELALSGGAARTLKVPSVAEVERELELAAKAGASFAAIREAVRRRGDVTASRADAPGP